LTTAEAFAHEWEDVARMLKGRAGEWAVIAEGLAPTKASSLASKIRRGDVAPFLNDGGGKFEASQHTEGAAQVSAAREVTVYARYAIFEKP
jgi:hypothetical protein